MYHKNYIYIYTYICEQANSGSYKRLDMVTFNQVEMAILSPRRGVSSLLRNMQKGQRNPRRCVLCCPFLRTKSVLSVVYLR